MSEPICDYEPVCCDRPMQYLGGHHDFTRQAYRCPLCGGLRVRVSTDRGAHWSDEPQTSYPDPAADA